MVINEYNYNMPFTLRMISASWRHLTCSPSWKNRPHSLALLRLPWYDCREAACNSMHLSCTTCCSQLPVETAKPGEVQEVCTTNTLAKGQREHESSKRKSSRGIVNLKRLASFVGEVSEHTHSCKNGTISRSDR